MTKFSFPKDERLKSKKTLARLFKEGRSFSAYPIRVVWILQDEVKPAPVQFTVSVPKKKFKDAVDRNRIKRQIKEAYRLHKFALLDKLQHQHQQGKSFAIMMIYVSTEKEPYEHIEKSVRNSLNRLMKDLRK
jgi:ribonuclease P protein component